MESQKASLETGATVAGRYVVDRLIGRGGMGEVYAAKNSATGRLVALKIIRTADVSAEQRRRFIREAKAATAISHPNVIDVLDVFEDDDGSPVMVMELLEGEPLSGLLKREKTPALGQVAAIMLPVARALQEAHDKGIVHRDLKPDNIFLGRGLGDALVPKVLDFGIAKVLDPTLAETQGSQTNTGSILGTPQYMSYEQAMSEKDIDHRADIWALGVILFEAVSGRRPLEFENLGQMYTQFLQGEVPTVREHAPDLPEGFANAIDHCLKKDRSERPSDLNALVEELERHADPDSLMAVAIAMGDASSSTVTGKTQGNFAAPPTEARAGRTGVWLGVAAAVLVASGTWWVVSARSDPGSDQAASAASSVAASAAPAEPTAEATPSTSAAASADSPTVDAGGAATATITPSVTTRRVVATPPPRPSATAAPPATASAPPTPTRTKGIIDELPY